MLLKQIHFYDVLYELGHVAMDKGWKLVQRAVQHKKYLLVAKE